MALAMLEQSKALTTLVSQLQGGDPLLDSQAISSPMSSKGAAGREKLQRDLSSRSGSFFLQVMQNAFRRMKPASAMPTSIAEIAATDFSFLQYLERCGGYGNSREMGLVMYSLAFVADAAIKDDMAGVQEHLALALVAIEQAVQDQNKWGLAFQLTLLEDPPPPMFTYRNYVPQSTGRMRAFAPLCPQRWATVALAYTKEMDYIQSRRTETSKKASPVPQQGPPSPKKRGKFPKAKQQNQGDQQEQDPGVEAVVSTSDLRGCDVREGTLLLPSSSTSVQANGSAICGRRSSPPVDEHPAMFDRSRDLGLGRSTDDHAELADFTGQAFAGHVNGGSSGYRNISFAAWPSVVLRNVLRSRTPFACFVRKAILSSRGGDTLPSSTALFPIPLPHASR